MALELRTCANRACPNIVPPSKNSGVPRLYCSIRCRQRVNGGNYYRRRAAEEAAARPRPQSGETRLCANETCTNIVEPAPSGRFPKIYCSVRCRQQQNARSYYQRHTGRGDGKIRLDPDGRPYVFRVIVKNAKAAETMFKNHLEDCPESGGGKCPARFDPYDWNRQCQLHAVLREDWDQLRRWERDKVRWKRVQTTEDGFWIEPPPERPIGITSL